jgi:methylated-DNA-[protein]-cysteine S-methyltransferase
VTIRVESPVGALFVSEADGAITRVSWQAGEVGEETPLLGRARAQLAEYFDGKRQAFDLPLRVSGSAFQQEVCAAMSAIPFGETRTYGEIARGLGVPAQAVGQACGANPVPVVIPCHRVLGATSLGGYSGEGGVETKVWLLRHEGAGGLLI